MNVCVQPPLFWYMFVFFAVRRPGRRVCGTPRICKYICSTGRDSHLWRKTGITVREKHVTVVWKRGRHRIGRS